MVPAEVLAAQEGWVPDGMWTAGKYQGPKSARLRLSERGSSAAAHPVPTNTPAFSPSAFGHSYYTQICAKCLYMKPAGKDWTALYLAY